MKSVHFNDGWFVKHLDDTGNGIPVSLPDDAMLREERTPQALGGLNVSWFEGRDYLYTKRFSLSPEEAVQRGMSMEQAMATWQTIDQVPERFVQQVDKKDEKQSFLDRVYEKYFTKTEKTGGVPSSQAIEIPD